MRVTCAGRHTLWNQTAAGSVAQVLRGVFPNRSVNLLPAKGRSLWTPRCGGTFPHHRIPYGVYNLEYTERPSLCQTVRRRSPRAPDAFGDPSDAPDERTLHPPLRRLSAGFIFQQPVPVPLQTPRALDRSSAAAFSALHVNVRTAGLHRFHPHVMRILPSPIESLHSVPTRARNHTVPCFRVVVP